MSIIRQDYGSLYRGGVKSPTNQTFSKAYTDSQHTTQVDLSTQSIAVGGRASYYITLDNVSGYKVIGLAYTPIADSHMLCSVRSFDIDTGDMAIAIFNLDSSSAHNVGSIRVKPVYVRNDYIES